VYGGDGRSDEVLTEEGKKRGKNGKLGVDCHPVSFQQRQQGQGEKDLGIRLDQKRAGPFHKQSLIIAVSLTNCNAKSIESAEFCISEG